MNLEPALRAADALDSHIVQGHVDGVATVRAIRAGREHVIEFTCPRELAGQMVPKGSIAVHGVSLTLVDVSAEGFSVALIPTTLGETTLGKARAGDRVNIETDVIGKYVLKYLRGIAPQRGQLTEDRLRQLGY